MGVINIITLKDVANEIQETRDGLPDYYKSNFKEGLKEDYAVNVSVFTPFRDGGLISGNVIIDDGEYGFYFDNDTYYYPYIILGTKPHDIYPLGGNITYMGETIRTGAHALYWEGAAHPVPMVHHPGTAPNDYMLNAYEETDPNADTRLDEMGSWIVGDQ